MSVAPNRYHLNREQTKQELERLKTEDAKQFHVCNKCNRVRLLTENNPEGCILFIKYMSHNINQGYCQVFVCNDCSKAEDFNE